jgi:hypothetical protein
MVKLGDGVVDRDGDDVCDGDVDSVGDCVIAISR